MNRKVLTLAVLLAMLVSASVAVVSAQETEEVVITVRGMATDPEHWRCDGFAEVVDDVNAQLEEEGDNRRITLELICDNPGWDAYKQEFVLASDAGEAPDIYLAGHEDIATLATAGYILDLTDMIFDEEGNFAYPQFADVVENLWDSVMYDGRYWGIPQDAEARPLYFSKPLLRELGWSDEEIESLPDRIESGEFTWEDLIATAQEAIEAGVVEPGYGYWHRPKNGPDFLYYYYGNGGVITEEGVEGLIFDTEAALRVYEFFYNLTQETGVTRSDMLGTLEWSEWHSTVSNAGDVLFWAGGTWNWGEWIANYYPSELDDPEGWLFENIGYALIPAFSEDGSPITLTHPLVYTISSGCEHPDLAMRLLAAVTTPEVNTLHAVESAHIGILYSQADYEPYTENEFLSSVLYMLDYTTFLPNSPYFTAWSNAYYEGIQAVEVGDLTPEEAVDFVVERLQNELGENITIR